MLTLESDGKGIHGLRSLPESVSLRCRSGFDAERADIGDMVIVKVSERTRRMMRRMRRRRRRSGEGDIKYDLKKCYQMCGNEFMVASVWLISPLRLYSRFTMYIHDNSLRNSARSELVVRNDAQVGPK